MKIIQKCHARKDDRYQIFQKKNLFISIAESTQQVNSTAILLHRNTDLVDKGNKKKAGAAATIGFISPFLSKSFCPFLA